MSEAMNGYWRESWCACGCTDLSYLVDTIRLCLCVPVWEDARSSGMTRSSVGRAPCMLCAQDTSTHQHVSCLTPAHTCTRADHYHRKLSAWVTELCRPYVCLSIYLSPFVSCDGGLRPYDDHNIVLSAIVSHSRHEGAAGHSVELETLIAESGGNRMELQSRLRPSIHRGVLSFLVFVVCQIVLVLLDGPLGLVQCCIELLGLLRQHRRVRLTKRTLSVVGHYSSHVVHILVGHEYAVGLVRDVRHIRELIHLAGTGGSDQTT
mmetsp:Transcript_42617/g.106412  ORF Transcript_42617/g.106412 Transcript_42617/m.106412 type:complete len:263 (+) Transcript_42617:1175-1963(+)